MKKSVFFLLIIFSSISLGLEPNEILILANKNASASMRVADYYSIKRQVPMRNIFLLDIPNNATEKISRKYYNQFIAGPLREKLNRSRYSGKIKCLLTTYQMPIVVGPNVPLNPDAKIIEKLEGLKTKNINKLTAILAQMQLLGRTEISVESAAMPKKIGAVLSKLHNESTDSLKRIEYISDEYIRKNHYKKWVKFYSEIYGIKYASDFAGSKPYLNFTMPATFKEKYHQSISKITVAMQEDWPAAKKLALGYYTDRKTATGLAGALSAIDTDLKKIKAVDTDASVDSELAMILFDNYDLYRWQENELKDKLFWSEARTLMVCRLDGPSESIATGLVDKAINAEIYGLKGTAYIDSRGLKDDNAPFSFGYYDKSLRELAAILKKQTAFEVVIEDSGNLFDAGQCPQAAFYCGWYSLRTYVDAFDFVDGAIGFHIASFEAQNLRNENATNWCPALLKDGITATIGPVNEPFLHAFPEPAKFFAQILNGKCLAEAYYRTNPFNSWQMILIGDPLYKPKIAR